MLDLLVTSTFQSLAGQDVLCVENDNNVASDVVCCDTIRMCVMTAGKSKYFFNL